MRALRTASLLAAGYLLLFAAPAQAWFGWLDNLSGAGPFNGLQIEVKLACYMDQRPEDARLALLTANTLTRVTFRELPPQVSDQLDKLASIDVTNPNGAFGAVNALRELLVVLQPRLAAPSPPTRDTAANQPAPPSPPQ